MIKGDPTKKKSKKLLLQSEERFRLLYDSYPISIGTIDLSGNIIDANRAMVEMTGYTFEELRGMCVGDLYVDIKEHHQLFELLQQSDKVRDIEMQLKRKDGSLYYALVNIDKIEMAGGTLLLTTARDISCRKQAEYTLKTSETRYRRLFETAQDGILLLDADTGQIDDVNPFLVDMLGYTKSEFLGKKLWEIGAFKDIEASKAAFKELQDKGYVRYEDLPLETKDGRDIAVEFVSNIYKVDGGKVIQCNIRDITARKQAEEALRKLNWSNELILTPADEGIFGLDREGKHTFVNPSASKMLGYEVKELIGKSGHTIWHHSKPDGSPYPEHESPIFMTIKDGIAHNITGEVFWRKDGTSLPVEYTSTPVREKGKTIGAVTTFRDITERKLAEEELKFRNIILSTQQEVSIDGILVVDENAKILSFNKQFLDMFGIPSELIEARFDEPVLQLVKSKVVEPQEFLQKVNYLYEHKQETSRDEVALRDGRTFDRYSAPMLGPDARYYGRVWYFRDITRRKQAEEELKQTLEKLRKALGGTIQAMAATVEIRDPYTSGHQKRVSGLACAIAQEMGLSKDMIEGIQMAGAIHDIGKMSVPAEILSKPTKLLEMEFSIIKAHPQTGYDILKEIDFPWPIAQIVLQHHERLNGSGYPNSLKDEEIFLEAKILAVADTVEAMASHRPYRPALGIDAALNEIEQNKGIHYDAQVVEMCVRLFREKGFKFE